MLHALLVRSQEALASGDGDGVTETNQTKQNVLGPDPVFSPSPPTEVEEHELSVFVNAARYYALSGVHNRHLQLDF